MKTPNSSSLVCLGSLALLFAGCARSTAFEKDQDYYQDYPHSYYSQGADGKKDTEKLALQTQPKKRMVVFDFYNDTPVVSDEIGEFSANELRRALYQSGKVIMPEDVKLQLSTKDFVQGDRIRVAQLIREGRRMGVGSVIIGKISRIVFRQKGDDVGILRQTQSMAAADVEIKVFDIEGGREISALGGTGEASSQSMVVLEEENLESRPYRVELAKLALRRAVEKLVPQVIRTANKMIWQGNVAKVIGNKIYINAGRTSGLVGGDILKVLAPGEDIYDPQSGAYLGRTPGQLKGTLEVTDFIGDDGAVGIVHSGGTAREGDLVRLY